MNQVVFTRVNFLMENSMEREKYSLPNGYKYEGDWKEGKIEGF